MTRRFIGFIMLAAVLAIPAQADSVSIYVEAFEEVQTRSETGVTVSLDPPSRIAPGDTVIIRLTYANSGDEPADDVVISNPVPTELEFIETRGSETALYSVDGGTTFGELSALVVAQADGEARPAMASDVTNVRWLLGSPLSPGASGTVSFAANLK